MDNAMNTLNLHKAVGDLRGEFFVPAYQRGFRWSVDDVRRLLEDIEQALERKEPEYTLQPVVVRKSGDRWELIDGQQRLTTLYLMFLAMRDRKLQLADPPYTLSYERGLKWTDFKVDVLDRSEEHIDLHHLAAAYRCIDDWFAHWGDQYNQHRRASPYFSYLNDNVKVIWYEPFANDELPPRDGELQAIKLFTRLNIGRIELNDAELVKAQLLTTVRKKNRDSAYELAAQWDAIERDLQRRDVWAFVSALDDQTTATEYPVRIGLLLDTLADKGRPRSTKRRRYETFDALRDALEHPKALWDGLTALHARILGWMDDPERYNKIGFLISSKTHALADILVAADTRKKSDFDSWLTERIRQTIDLSRKQLVDLRYNVTGHYMKLLHALLLFNVETLSRAGQRFPFAEHAGEDWSLEHIHAQQSEGLNKESQWRMWLSQHLSALSVRAAEALHAGGSRVDIDTLIRDVEVVLQSGEIERPTFLELHARTVRHFGDGEPDHCIHNLALLSSSRNSELSNAVFEVKRQRILEHDKRGEYIPICTRHVFVKYYAPLGAEQLHFWSDDDKKGYFEAIISDTSGIGRYLAPEGERI